MQLLMRKDSQWYEMLNWQQREDAQRLFTSYQRILQFMIAADVGWTGMKFPLGGRDWILCENMTHVVNVSSVYPDPFKIERQDCDEKHTHHALL